MLEESIRKSTNSKWFQCKKTTKLTVRLQVLTKFKSYENLGPKTFHLSLYSLKPLHAALQNGFKIFAHTLSSSKIYS